MTVKIVKKILNNDYFTFNAMALLPSQDANEPSSIDTWAIFTHGYTASKRDCLPWAQRLAEAGIPAVIFDLPGHYLGSFHECESFEDFKEHAHECHREGDGIERAPDTSVARVPIVCAVARAANFQ